jgi:heterodisulfide reductase subunit A
VHSNEPEKATEKSKTLIRMSVARANLAEPLIGETSSVTKSALIVGGGIAGLTAAMDLDSQGIDVTLIEKEGELGGRLRELHKLSPEGIEASKVLTQKMKDLLKSNVNVMTSATLDDVKGYVGNFTATIKSLEGVTTKDFGAIILAIGSELYEPSEYGYAENENVITNLELEKMMEEGPIEGKTVSFILRRSEERGVSRVFKVLLRDGHPSGRTTGREEQGQLPVQGHEDVRQGRGGELQDRVRKGREVLQVDRTPRL